MVNSDTYELIGIVVAYIIWSIFKTRAHNKEFQEFLEWREQTNTTLRSISMSALGSVTSNDSANDSVGNSEVVTV